MSFLGLLGGSAKTSVDLAELQRKNSQIQYDEIQKVTSSVLGKTKLRPKLGIICGSGLGGLANEVKDQQVIPYAEIDGFPKCTVPGHDGNLVLGKLSGVPTVCMQGRLHFYEGHPAWLVTMPIRMMKLIGVETLIVTNASGGLNQDYNRGDIMVIKDHINLTGLTGQHPLVGPNDEKFGPRFPAMTTPYDPELRRLAQETAKELGFSGFMREGVYVKVSGPSYETPSESRLLRKIGADTVGMSTAPEVVVAIHAGMKVLGFSMVTNMVILDQDSDKTPPTHQEVMDTANEHAKDLQLLVKTIVGKLASTPKATESAATPAAAMLHKEKEN